MDRAMNDYHSIETVGRLHLQDLQRESAMAALAAQVGRPARPDFPARLASALLKWLPRRQTKLAPSLYDVFPEASMLPRTLPRAEVVAADEISGTTRHPSNTTADLLPIPPLRSRHWRQKFRRVVEAQARLVFLPPVELVKVGCSYFIVDGHKRVAAARQIDGVVDAVVVELRPARDEQPTCRACA
jgi:hypothetical protein